MALSMFTILPTPYIKWDDDGVKNMMKFYPIIGLIVGSIWSIVYYLISIYKCFNYFKKCSNYDSTIYSNRNVAFRWIYGCLRCNSFKKR